MEYYTHIKALHLISAIAWIAALLYLPRLFVYHVQIVGTQAERNIPRHGKKTPSRHHDPSDDRHLYFRNLDDRPESSFTLFWMVSP